MIFLLTCLIVFLCAVVIDWSVMCVADMRRTKSLPTAVWVPWALVIILPALLLTAMLVIYPFLYVQWHSVRGIPAWVFLAVPAAGAAAMLAYVLRDRGIFARRLAGKRRSNRGIPLKGFWVFSGLFIYWKLVGDYQSLSAPPPPTWWTAGQAVYDSGELMPAFWETMGTFVAGFAGATLAGVVVGNAVGSSPRLDRALGPTLEFMRTSPSAPYVPILLLFLPGGRSFSVLIITISAMWPVLLNTAAARRSVPPLRIDVARTFDLGAWAQQQKIILPSLIPGVAVGLRIAGPVALIITLLVDLLTTTGGLGSLLTQYQQIFEASGAYSMIIIVGIIGWLVNLAVVRMESFLMRRWPDTAF